jgi:methylated-DNA-[protein]-cysteine S-methyltransferase
MNFDERCYEILKKVPKGKITTYKEIAKALKTQAYRAVGNAMKNNPYSPEVPCHRVIRSDGYVGGFKGKDKGKTVSEKIRLLKKEGIEFKGNKIKNFNEVFFKF